MNRILIIEDDLLTQKFLTRILNSEFEIDICDSAEEFYQKYSSNNYVVIIMDISLRGSKHGLELTKEIKMLKNFDSTPILCFTAHAFPRDKEAAQNSGVDLFLTKPASNKTIIDAVHSLL